jgi:ribosome modulation factor
VTSTRAFSTNGDAIAINAKHVRVSVNPLECGVVIGYRAGIIGLPVQVDKSIETTTQRQSWAMDWMS